MASSESIKVVSRPATLRDSVRLILLFYSDPSLAKFLGVLERYAAILASIISHAIRQRNDGAPLVILALEGDKTVGGMLLKTNGLFMYAVVDARAPNRIPVLRGLRTAVDRMLEEESRDFRLWTFRQSIVQAAIVRHFEHTGRVCYVHTTTLAHIRISWLSNRASSELPFRFLAASSVELVELRRPAQVSGHSETV